jgi:hypothetical protein
LKVKDQEGKNENHFSHIYSASTGMVTHNSHILAPGRNCMTRHQALQDFPDMSQVLLYKNNKINLPIL